MSTFTIDAENNITALAGPATGTDQSQSFSNAKELAKLTAEWPASRLVETWNSFAGVAPFDDLKPVKKFTSRKLAVARIWQAVARLSPDAAQPALELTLRPPQQLHRVNGIHSQSVGAGDWSSGHNRPHVRPV